MSFDGKQSVSRGAHVVASGPHPSRRGLGRWLSSLGRTALLLALASAGVASASEYKSTRARVRPSVSAACSGFAMLQAEEAPPGAAAAERRAQVKSPAWRREGLRQHLAFYRTACPDADASPLRRASPQGAR